MALTRFSFIWIWAKFFAFGTYVRTYVWQSISFVVAAVVENGCAEG